MLRGALLLLAAASVASCGNASPVAETKTPGPREVGVLTIEPQALATRLEAGEAIQLIDVRSAEEFAEGHIAGAINLPVDVFDPAKLPDAGGADLFLYCRSDRRSGIAAERLAEAKNATAVHMEGGILAWEEAGLPVKQ
ncbi:rhodanese-like domain-containing protein [Qipengyuania sp. 1NDH17]|uniref:Rhodanese-like domain-containing protein n=1 Tax=Qipengyuania polymorpha TaxID=2867234 RepID=A0ABS7J6H5_9SPHN|nr:rhodanese-like domain-containing protein [Qipengyuania polymorpha]MBX7459053.1 rhodanese-like domain-containing protein [Qipengyuania polymorpha]